MAVLVFGAVTAARTEPVAAPASVGPATAALYEKKSARKAVVDEAAAKLKAIAQPEVPAAAPRAPGRRRKKPEAAGGDEA